MKNPQTLYCAAVLLLGAALPAAAADGYPSKPIRIIVPSAPGSGPDIIARLIGGKLTDAWGQQIVADDRAGAAGIIGSEIAAKAASDGYTLELVTSQTLISTLFFDKLPFNLLKDFSPICLIASTPYVLVANPAVPVTSIKELIALAKAKPGTLHYGSSGTGGALHLVGEMFKIMADVNIVHVPYKSVVYALIDVMGGQVELAYSVVPAALPMIKQKKLRALGVTSLKRTPLVPDVEAIAETVPGYEILGWYGMVAPVKTPDAIIATLNAEIIKALQSAEVRDKLRALGAEPMGTTPREFASFLSAEMDKTRKTVKASGMRKN